MNAVEILENLDVDNMSIAKKASLIRDMIDYLKITDKEIEEYQNSQPEFEKEQKEAAANLSTVVNQINNWEKQEINYVQSISNINQEISVIRNTLEENNSSNSDDDTNNNAEQSKEDKQVELTSNTNAQEFVIPVLIDRVITLGKEIKDGITYKSEEYTATLKLEKDSQTLSLDRNSPELTENQEVLLASKDNDSREYTIIVNNLTQEEFERFKALFEEQKARKEQSKLSTENESTTELD